MREKKIHTTDIDVIYMILWFSLWILGSIFWDIIKEFIWILSQPENVITAWKFYPIFIYGICFVCMFLMFDHIISKNIALSKMAIKLLGNIIYFCWWFLTCELFLFLCISIPQILQTENLYNIAVDISLFKTLNIYVVIWVVIFLYIYLNIYKKKDF